MAKFGDMLSFLRKRANMSQQELADKLNITRSAIGMYETGKREPDFETLEVLADFFNVDMNTLVGVSEKVLADNIIPMPKTYKVPLLGSIACGEPILATENIDGEVDVPEDIHADFALRCKGDSMINARIFDGDIVYIRQQETIENGEIAAVLIEDEATLKRVHLFGDHIILSPENPMYKPFVYWGEDMNSIRILGRAEAFTSAVR